MTVQGVQESVAVDLALPVQDGDIFHAERMLRGVAGLANDAHGQDTARRFVNALREMTACSDSHDAIECTKWKTFEATSDEMIVVQDIPFVSVCNHHVLPFIGVVHVGYVPRDKIAGLSKFKRVVDHYSRRLQVQERMTGQIADFLSKNLEPKGLALVVKAEHLCMSIRGAQAHGTFTTTNAMLGVFGDHSRTAKMEFLTMINGGRL
jgi:GTP cyclohydrolase I